MHARLLEWLEKYANIPQERTQKVFQRVLIVCAGMAFVLLSTVIVAFDDIFLTNSVATLEIGNISPRSISSPQTTTYISRVLTDEARVAARDAVQPIFDPPNPNIARQQTQLAQQILIYILNVRRDLYGTNEQKLDDLDKISPLTLDERIRQNVLTLSDDAWNSVSDEVINVLSLVLREAIRPNNLQTVIDQLSNQVSIRFNPQERDIIVNITQDLVRANTFENVEATESARERAALAIAEITRTFLRGERVIGQGEIIGVADYEALGSLGLLRSTDLRFQTTLRTFALSTLIMVITGLFLIRFEPLLVYQRVEELFLLGTLFLILLGTFKALGINGNIYIFPMTALSLLFVPLARQQVAVIATISLSLLGGVMANNSLEITVFILAGGLIGILTLHRSERLNAYFVAGAMVGIVNVTVVSLFNIGNPTGTDSETLVSVLFAAFLGGAVLTPATAIASMYIVTQLFNLPTPLKLLDISQPSKPLLQRLLREAPGSYQHSLQVANLAEHASSAIHADAQLVYVSALYHDIGKMLNPLYFTENQQDIVNPHDTLNDPYRSAQIIIGHIIEGDELAKQHRLPARIRDFILEHHGTTQVYVFYQRALNQSDGDVSAVDIADFTYPGPRPRSRETAVLMLADSCEATVRAIKPHSKQEIMEVVEKIIEDKRNSGQLDDSGLTLSDLKIIKQSFVEVLLGMFHPRINYSEAIAKKTPSPMQKVTGTQPRVEPVKLAFQENNGDKGEPNPAKRTLEIPTPRQTKDTAPDDDEPVAVVPRLPRPNEAIKPVQPATHDETKESEDPA